MTKGKLKVPKVSKRNRKTNPWITDRIIASVKTKSTLFKEWVKSKSQKAPNGDVTKYNKFSTYRKFLKKVIKNAKSKYYCKKINEHEGDKKKTWAVVNELRGKGKGSIKPPFIINNTRITDRRIIANEFNKYFVSVASVMNSKVYESPGIPMLRVKSFEE